MALSRRDFVKLCSGTVAGFGVSQMFHPAIHEAFAQTLTGERPPVFWVQGQGCTGCSVTLLNSDTCTAASKPESVLLSTEKYLSEELSPTVASEDIIGLPSTSTPDMVRRSSPQESECTCRRTSPVPGMK